MKPVASSLSEVSKAVSIAAIDGIAVSRGMQECTVQIYENAVPEFAAGELERLYENFFSSVLSFDLSDKSGGASTYVARNNGVITTLLLFRLEDGKVRVLNEMIRIPGEEISRFAEHVFSHFPSATSIAFRAIATSNLNLAYPFQRFGLTEDIVLSLPESVQDYQARLGKSTRKTINENMNRLKRRFPSFEFSVHQKNDAREEDIRTIIRFNRERMAGKGKTAGTEEDESRHIHDLVKACGLVFIVRAEDRICAGQICFQVGDNYFSLLNAHSPEFNPFRLGTLCNYLSICECIRRGGKEFHFLWGREEFKYRFLGEQRDFDELVIYRSPLHMVLNGGLALKTAIEGKKRQVRLWLIDPKRSNHPALGIARKMIRRFNGAQPHS